ncbi:MAG: patatin-like phospholipase family protein [Candidatus Eisenbacteria bacterium]|uniref:Patatin-like phospholipase family protein n=1 Tax=Eiseniibacteriota bacterium TaxID=2212470 RepID=A0A948W2J5_UNCEI|nr:patatin-like phospholipase family protein [Candidatus Eisenbacteria bacterium]MBU1949900.1 patatin-like phospholipase family protein [Candidatus Eisenbacteria bacterium]MBU2690022.1 patatin-like phospholipase family protein [Candidatus Eisenbacteria bacterium]
MKWRIEPSWPRILLIAAVCFLSHAAGLLADAPAPAGDILPPQKIGLVLSGGGARGFAHIGTLKMLDSLQIHVDVIAGTSMGGILGALYAIGYTGREIEEMVCATDWEEIFSDSPPRSTMPYIQKKDTGRYQLTFGFKGTTPAPPSGLIFGQKVSLLFSRLTFPLDGPGDFDRLPIPYRCVAIDLVTGDQVVLDHGSLPKAMRSTMAIPTIFSPVEWGDSLLIDGGSSNNLPVDIAKEMGADIIIAADVGGKLKSREELNSALSIFEQWIEISDHEHWQRNMEMVDIYIKPDLANINMGDFARTRIPKIIKSGEREAIQQASKIDSICGMIHRDRAPNPEKIQFKDTHDKAFDIRTIYIEGEKNLPSDFVRSHLRLKPGEKFDTDQLNRDIMSLYSLGYYESILYETQMAEDGLIDLIITVKELPLRKLRLGIRYDDRHKLVGAMAIQTTNLPLPGLRLENELQFAGLMRYTARASFPSRTLRFPIYPFADLSYRYISTDVFAGSGKLAARYDDRATVIGIGFGVSPGGFFNAEFSYQSEFARMKPTISSPSLSTFSAQNDDLERIQAILYFDTLDGVLLPRQGFQIEGRAERADKAFNTEIEYNLIDISGDFYLTLLNRHTFRLFGYWAEGSDDTPYYRYRNMGKPETFVGMEYDQLAAGPMSLIRLDYRYQAKKEFFIKLIGNTAYDFQYKLRTDETGAASDPLWGFGVGAGYASPIGPLQLIWSTGSRGYDETRKSQNVVYFTMGCRF